MTTVDATVVIVNYNGRLHLAACLDGLALQSGPTWESVVVDNASVDESWSYAQDRSGVRLIRNSQNVGFGRGCNQGAAGSSARYLVFLNFDSIPEPGWLSGLVAAADADPGLAAVQGVVMNARDGTVNTAGNRLHYLGFSWAPAAPRPPEGEPYSVAVASGASLLVRREAWDECGAFWDSIFLYHEDVELSWRLRAAGWRIACAPAARTWHDYEFSRNPEKWFHLERNRLLFVFATYERRTLVRLAPALAITELAVIAVAVRGRWLRQKLRAYASLPRAFRELRRWRHGVQELRRVDDRELSRLHDARLGLEFGAWACGASARLLALLARVAGLAPR
jgi:GT2 family glycosyltransferase